MAHNLLYVVHAFVSQAHAKELAAKFDGTSDAQAHDSMDMLASKLVVRALSTSPAYQSDLDSMTDEKPRTTRNQTLTRSKSGSILGIDRASHSEEYLGLTKTPGTKMTRNKKLFFVTALAFLTGYTDVICFARYTAFGSKMTGNLILMAKSLGETGWAVASGHLLPLPVFYLIAIICRNAGLGLYHIMVQISKVGAAVILGPLFVALMFIAELFQFLYVSHIPWMNERWHVWLVAIVYGVQRQVTVPALGVVTTFATGHLSNIFHTLMSVALKEKSRTELHKIVMPAIIVSALFGGALFGAYLNTHLKGRKEHAFLLTPSTAIQVILWLVLERKVTLVPTKGSAEVPQVRAVSVTARDPIPIEQSEDSDADSDGG